MVLKYRYTIRSVTIILFGLWIFVFAGCSSKYTLDDFDKKIKQDTATIDTWKNIENAQPLSTLYDLIESEAIKILVEQALKNNPSLEQTRLTLQSYRLYKTITDANRLPNVNFSSSISRTESEKTVRSSEVDISWEADVWGKLNDSSKAAVKSAKAQKALYDSARDILAAEVIQAYIEYVRTYKALEIEQKHFLTLKKNDDFIKERYVRGLSSLADVYSARSSAQSLQATLAKYKEAVNKQRRSLRILLGDTNDKQLKNTLLEYPNIKITLSQLPAQTLARRPDMKAAYFTLQSTVYQSKATYKELLPSLNLQAILKDSTHLIFADPVWTLLGGLSAPIFNNGSLKASAHQSDIAAASAYESYRETLIAAVKEVEDTLGQERSISLQQKYLEEALVNAQKTQNQYEENYKKGISDMLDLLTVQTKTYDIEAQLNTLISQRLSNRVDLALALGLGVENEY
jgi:NodT family efflux transporter outer membrane factor (OMF) lipoprotein